MADDTKKNRGEVKAPKYTTKERDYLNYLRTRMATARNVRENAHDEFDGMNFTQYTESNRKSANAYIAPKKNKEDTNFVTGTTRQKMILLLSVLNNLNLGCEFKAFNEKQIEEVEIGKALEDIVSKTEQLDNDDEKQFWRQYELLEQGTVFVEEVWDQSYEIIKDFKNGKDFDGNNFDEVEWTEKLVQTGDSPIRNTLLPENVYLGDITQFYNRKQPFIFTVEQIPYQEAASIYGKWKRWENVSRDAVYFDAQSMNPSQYNNNWTLTELKKDHCEIAKYQDRYANEYGVIINGVLMTPVGLPIPRKWGKGVEYNIEKQTCLPISPSFAYGRSVPSLMKVKQGLLDEMMRLAILKTQKSFLPPYANQTGVQLSTRIFMPAKITAGIDADLLKPLGDTKGVSKSELSMIQEIQKSMDDDAANPILSGKNPHGVSRVSATQSQQLKQQADLSLTLIVFSAMKLEEKLGMMRLYNVLENWFDPIAEVAMPDIKGKLVKKYRSATVDKMIDGEGPGQSIVEVSDTPDDPVAIFRREEEIKKRTGQPVRITMLNATVMKSGRLMFYPIAAQKPKKTSDLAKVLFNEMFEAAQKFQNLDMDYMSQRFATVWGENPTKMFKKMSQMPQDGDPNAAGGGGGAPAGGQGARGSIMPKSMTHAGKPRRPSVNALETQG